AFGVTLVVKVGLFAVLVAFAWRNRSRNVPALSADARRVSPLRRAVAAELVLATAVFAVTGVLTELPPSASVAEARGASSAAAQRPLVVTGHDFATSVRVRLTVSPGTVGRNRFSAAGTDFDT